MNATVARVIAIVSGLVLVVGVTFALRAAGLDLQLAALIGGAVGFGDYFVIYMVLTQRPK